MSDLIAKLRAAGCVYAEDEAQLLVSAAETSDELDAMVERRVAGFPLEYILGWAEFCGLRIVVGPGVFIPRRRSEFLAHQAIALASEAIAERGRSAGASEDVTNDILSEYAWKTAEDDGSPRYADQAMEDVSQSKRLVVVDLCCGSGALGAALVAASSGIELELYATDIDPAAVQYARINIPAPGRVLTGDLYEPLPANLRGRVNLLLANTPYVPSGAIGMMPAEARLHEAPFALDGGVDGLDIQRRVAASAPMWLAPGGCLLVETSASQAPQTVAIFARCGLIPSIARSDKLDATVVIGAKSVGYKPDHIST